MRMTNLCANAERTGKKLFYLLHFSTKNENRSETREIRTINIWTRSATEINIYKINGISSNHFQRIILFHDMPTHSMHWLRSCDAMLHNIATVLGAPRVRKQFINFIDISYKLLWLWYKHDGPKPMPQMESVSGLSVCVCMCIEFQNKIKSSTICSFHTCVHVCDQRTIIYFYLLFSVHIRLFLKNQMVRKWWVVCEYFAVQSLLVL